MSTGSLPPTQPGQPAQPGQSGPASGTQASPRHPSPTASTRTSTTYVAVTVGVIVLILLIIFIVQNLEDANFHYLGAHFELPVGVLMLISGVAGGLIVLLVSLARVWQLRVRSRRAQHHHPDHQP